MNQKKTILHFSFLGLLVACQESPVAEKNSLPPFSPIVNIQPEQPNTSDSLHAVLLSSELVDPDTSPDDLRLEWKWAVDGEELELPASQTIIHSGMTQRGQKWTLKAVVFDGENYSKVESVDTIIANASPRAENIATSTALPRTDDDLIIENIDLRDADDDEVTATLRWTKNGADDLESEGLYMVESNRTTKGDRWAVEIIPYDGIEVGEPTVIGFTIQNTAPVLSSVEVGPNTVERSAPALANLIASDADGDEIQSQYQWFINGELLSDIQSTPLPPDYFERGDEIQVEGNVFDGESVSETRRSSAIVVQNAPPTMAAVLIEPANASAKDDLSCEPIAPSDLDLDLLTTEINWFINEQWISNEAILNAEFLVKGDSVRCQLTLHDGIDASEEMSDEKVIGNAKPEIVSIEVTDPASSESVVFCMASGTDHDNDIVTYGYEWFVNGTKITHAGSYLSSLFFNLSPGDMLSCRVTPYDGIDYGTASISDPVDLVVPNVRLSGRTMLGSMAVGGLQIESNGLIATTEESSLIDGGYSIDTPTLSFGSVSVETPHMTVPEQVLLGSQDQEVDFTITQASFPTSQDRLEPNDDMQTAAVLLIDGALRHGVIQTDWDEDYFETDLTAGEQYAFFTTHLHWATSIEMDLIDSNGRIMLQSTSCLGGETCIMEASVAHDGPHYLRVRAQENGPDRADYFIGAVTWQDNDLDGYVHHHDCNDFNPDINVGASEIPGDGIDQNCSGIDTPLPIGDDHWDPVDNVPAGAGTLSITHNMPEEWFFRKEETAETIRFLGENNSGSTSDIDYFKVSMLAKSRYRLLIDPRLSLANQNCSITVTVFDEQFNSLNGPIEMTDQTVTLIENATALTVQRYVRINGTTPCAYLLLLQSEGQDLDGDGHYSESRLDTRDRNDLDASVQ